jgi:hypothetical protein
LPARPAWVTSRTGCATGRRVTGRTKTEVRDKLRELHKQVEGGLRPQRRYTVGDALEDWLAHGVDGLSARTVTLYWGTIVKALTEELGAVRLTELTARDVHGALTAMASQRSTRTLQIAHNVLVRAIRQAERDNLVGRNVMARCGTAITARRRAGPGLGGLPLDRLHERPAQHPAALLGLVPVDHRTSALRCRCRSIQTACRPSYASVIVGLPCLVETDACATSSIRRDRRPAPSSHHRLRQ